MARITTVLIPSYAYPKEKPSRQMRHVTFEFSPTQLAANVTSGDTIAIATLPKDARIDDCGVRMVGVSGLSLAFVQLQISENSVASLLTNPLSATVAGAIGMVAAPPRVNNAYVKTLELVVGGNSIDSTATGIIVVTCDYGYLKMAG